MVNLGFGPEVLCSSSVRGDGFGHFGVFEIFMVNFKSRLKNSFPPESYMTNVRGT